MSTTLAEKRRFQSILEEKAAELGRALGKRDDITIEKSADQMDEIQYASERDLAIRNVDRDSTMLRQVKGGLRRLSEETFGICADCETEISIKRLTAVPWAERCIQCQELFDRAGNSDEDAGDTLDNAA